jgi:hypothetical protein
LVSCAEAEKSGAITRLASAFRFAKPNFKSGGQECPPYTVLKFTGNSCACNNPATRDGYVYDIDLLF